MKTEAQIKAKILLDMQPTGDVHILKLLPWVVQALQFLLVEKALGK